MNATQAARQPTPGRFLNIGDVARITAAWAEIQQAA